MSLMQEKVLMQIRMLLLSLILVPLLCEAGQELVQKMSCSELVSSSVPKIEKIPDELGKRYFARLIRGTLPEHFRTLTSDLGREVVMTIDSDGIEQLKGKTPGQMLSGLLGYEEAEIQRLRSLGTKYVLVLFENRGDISDADWAGLGKRLSNGNFPPVVNFLFQKYEAQLRTLPFSEIEAQASTTFSDTYSRYYLERSNPVFMTADKLTENSTLVEFRAFLYNDLRLTELYTGTGYTHNPSTGLEVREYFHPNREIKDLPGVMVIEFP